MMADCQELQQELRGYKVSISLTKDNIMVVQAESLNDERNMTCSISTEDISKEKISFLFKSPEELMNYFRKKGISNVLQITDLGHFVITLKLIFNDQPLEEVFTLKSEVRNVTDNEKLEKKVHIMQLRIHKLEHSLAEREEQNLKLRTENAELLNVVKALQVVPVPPLSLQSKYPTKLTFSPDPACSNFNKFQYKGPMIKYKESKGEPAQLVAKELVPMKGKWSFTIKIVHSEDVLGIGFLSQANMNESYYTGNKRVLIGCLFGKIFYKGGWHSAFEKPCNGSEVTSIIDREAHKVRWVIKGQEFSGDLGKQFDNEPLRMFVAMISNTQCVERV